jgi:hypothetical protein
VGQWKRGTGVHSEYACSTTYALSEHSHRIFAVCSWLDMPIVFCIAPKLFSLVRRPQCDWCAFRLAFGHETPLIHVCWRWVGDFQCMESLGKETCDGNIWQRWTVWFWRRRSPRSARTQIKKATSQCWLWQLPARARVSRIALTGIPVFHLTAAHLHHLLAQSQNFGDAPSNATSLFPMYANACVCTYTRVHAQIWSLHNSDYRMLLL